MMQPVQPIKAYTVYLTFKALDAAGRAIYRTLHPRLEGGKVVFKPYDPGSGDTPVGYVDSKQALALGERMKQKGGAHAAHVVLIGGDFLPAIEGPLWHRMIEGEKPRWHII